MTSRLESYNAIRNNDIAQNKAAMKSILPRDWLFLARDTAFFFFLLTTGSCLKKWPHFKQIIGHRLPYIIICTEDYIRRA